MPAITEASRLALDNLRASDHFEWYLVVLLAFVVYVYVVEIERSNWRAVTAGLFFLGIEFAWEIFNALVLRITDSAAMWTTPGDTAYLLLVGLTIEIALMFSVAGVILSKALPENREKKIIGVPNRIFVPVAFALFCVFVEVVLNALGVLVWEHSWWNWPNIWLIIFAYCFGFLACAWYHDLESGRFKTSLLVCIFAFDVVVFTVLASVGLI